MSTKDTLSKKLSDLKVLLPTKAKEAVRESSVASASIVKKHTPRSGDSYARRTQRQASRIKYHSRPLADAVKTKVKMGQNPSYTVGYNKNQGWRAHFLRGTKHQRPSNHHDAMYKEVYETDYDIKVKKIKEAFE